MHLLMHLGLIQQRPCGEEGVSRSQPIIQGWQTNSFFLYNYLSIMAYRSSFSQGKPTETQNGHTMEAWNGMSVSSMFSASETRARE